MSNELKDLIRAAGGIVHGDGNIFFTNAEQFQRAAIVASQRKPLTDDEIEAIGHRKASTYTHRSDPTSHAYGFVRHTLIDFARVILAAKGESK